MKAIKMDVQVREIPTVKVDESYWTEDEIKHFNDYMYDSETVEDIARHALTGVLHLGENSFIEGFGYIKVNGSFPWGIKEEEKCTSVEIDGLNVEWEVETW